MKCLGAPALPLVEIEDATALEQKVIEPLVKAIG